MYQGVSMKLSSYEEFLVHDKTWNEEARTEALNKFPYTAVVEGCYPANDVAYRWCWQQFGPPECKQCYDYSSEYPACPMVLAIEEYIIKKSYTDKEGKVHEYDYHTREPEKHGHEGTWTTVWLGKTGYDYGFTEYYFLNESDRDKFIATAPSFDFGENYV